MLLTLTRPPVPTSRQTQAVDAAGLVYHIGFSSHFDNRAGKSSWPLPRVNAQKLGAFAEERGILME